MANGEGPMRAWADMTPDEREALYSNMYRARRIPPPAAGSETVPPPPDIAAATIPAVSGARGSPIVEQDPYLTRLQSRADYLTGKLNEPRKTGWGRVGQVLGTVGQDVGTAVAPETMAMIPGTTLNRRLELQAISKELGEEQGRRALREEAGQRTGIEQQRADIEQQRADIERAKAGMVKPVSGGREYTLGQRQFREFEFPGGATGWGEIGGPAPTANLPTIGAPVSQMAPGEPGQLPHVVTPPPAYGVALPPGGYFGAPKTNQTPLKPEEIAAQNAQTAQFWDRLNPGKPMPNEYRLQPGATQEDLLNMRQMLESTQRAAGTEEARKQRDEDTQARLGMAREAAAERKETAGAKMVRAVDNNGKVHYMSRADYDANAANFHPNPIGLVPGQLDKATDHATTINEMQGRMNAAAEAIQRFNWNDEGQKSIVIQAMRDVDKSYADNLIGIPIMGFVASELKKLGLAGATPETRQYIVDILSLREGMLGMPKEITGGSRMFEKATEALWSTLPTGATPDRAWAMAQMRAAQNQIDRVRGTRVPIIEGMEIIPKVPALYQHSATNPRTNQKIYSDDQRNWVDGNGRPVR